MKRSLYINRFLSPVLIALALWGSSLAQPGLLKGLDNYIQKALMDWDIPGLSIAIVRNDKIVYAKGFGVGNIYTKDPVDENTIFAIASNTKAFTTTGLGLLVQEGKLDWDDPVLKYLPEFQLFDPVATRKITIRDLLCHRSGLGTWQGDLTWFGSNYDPDEVIHRIRFIPPVADFRTSYRYSNLMFLVAGQIISEVTSITWQEFTKQRFFYPLNMQRSNTSVKELRMVENVATPHTLVNERLDTISYVPMDNCAPAGGINSCVNDVTQWLRLQLQYGNYDGKQLVDSTIIYETRQPHNLIQIGRNAKNLNPYVHFSDYALGWRLSDYQGQLVVNHTGGLDGMLSYVGFLPEQNLGVVILTNSDNHNLMNALPYHIYDLYLGEKFQDWSARYLDAYQENRDGQKEKVEERKNAREDGTILSHPQADYCGTYTSQIYGDAVIQLKNGEITIRLLAHPYVIGVLKHWQYDTFLSEWNYPVWKESYLYFDLDDQGTIKQFRVAIRPDWIDTQEYVFIKNQK